MGDLDGRGCWGNASVLVLCGCFGTGGAAAEILFRGVEQYLTAWNSEDISTWWRFGGTWGCLARKGGVWGKFSIGVSVILEEAQVIASGAMCERVWSWCRCRFWAESECLDRLGWFGKILVCVDVKLI